MSMPSTAEATARYAEQEWETRVELAAFYRVVHHYRMTDIANQEIGARVRGEPDRFLIHPDTASSVGPTPNPQVLWDGGEVEGWTLFIPTPVGFGGRMVASDTAVAFTGGASTYERRRPEQNPDYRSIEGIEAGTHTHPI